MLIDPLLAPVRLLEVAHVAHRLSSSVGFVRQLIHTHKLPAIRLGRRFLVDPVDLQRFIDAQRVKPADPPEQHRGRDGPRLHTVSQDKGA